MRLIDADALIERVEDDIKAIEDKEPVIAMGAIGVLNTIKKAPPVEQDRPKGEWKHGRELSRVFIGDALRGINYEDWHCSNCHCVVEQSIKPKWSYCPNCGADMRGDAE